MADEKISASSHFYEESRERMVQDQLIARGIEDPRVLAAMRAVPREAFVPEPYRAEAYADCPLPIGYGQTISQPFTVAFMLQALRLTGSEKVLDIGTGSGYAAAVLAHIVDEVQTVERVAPLTDQARGRLNHLGLRNVHVHTADGTMGLPEFAPFDAIVVAAGAHELPQPLVDQLADKGRIVIPIGPGQAAQTMYRYTRNGNQLTSESLGGFAFVPLIGQHGW